MKKQDIEMDFSLIMIIDDGKKKVFSVLDEICTYEGAVGIRRNVFHTLQDKRTEALKDLEEIFGKIVDIELKIMYVDDLVNIDLEEVDEKTADKIYHITCR
jgi:hypothetical protein